MPTITEFIPLAEYVRRLKPLLPEEAFAARQQVARSIDSISPCYQRLYRYPSDRSLACVASLFFADRS
jgi:hypothetical protein